MWWWMSLVFGSLVTVNCAVYQRDREFEIVADVFEECVKSKDRYSCLAEKAALAVERSMNWDIPIFDGLKFKRNDEKLNETEARSMQGFDRFTTAVTNFVNSHSLAVGWDDEAEVESSRAARDGYGGGGGKRRPGGGGLTGLGSLGINRKAIKKEAKYMRYAFMVLLGIFGLTGPLVMKTLALIAGQALLASKAALLIVGGVALKKIFEHNDHHEKTSVKVHTIPSYDHDSHDRMGYNYITSYNPYSSYSHYARNGKQLNNTL